jgi:hypothetical protein
VLRSAAGAEAVGIPSDELFVALLHLGYPRQSAAAPDREPPDRYATFLD